MKSMRSLISQMLLGIVTLSTAALAKTEIKTIVVPNFDSLELAGKVDVELVVGAKQSVEVETDASNMDKVEISVKDKVLVIGNKRSSDWSFSFKDQRTIVRITAPVISDIGVSGACTIKASGFTGGSLDFEGSGAIEATLNGLVDTLSIDISGAAEIKAFELKAQAVKLDISGSAQIEVYAVKTIQSDVSGAASVLYKGTPAVVKSDISGMGTMKPRG
jgi:hypothetical protein